MFLKHNLLKQTHSINIGHFANFELAKNELIVNGDFERGATTNIASNNSFRNFAQNHLSKIYEGRLVTSPTTLKR